MNYSYNHTYVKTNHCIGEKHIKKNEHNIKEKNEMKKKKSSEKNGGKWMLIDKHRKVLFASEKIADVVEEGRKYKMNEVTIEKKLVPGTCFF